MCADAIRQYWQTTGLLRDGMSRSLGDCFNADCVHTKRQVQGMLFGVPDRGENDFTFFRIRWNDQLGDVNLRHVDGIRAKAEVDPLWRESVNAGKPVVAQGIEQVFDNLPQHRLWNFQPGTAPAEREG